MTNSKFQNKSARRTSIPALFAIGVFAASLTGCGSSETKIADTSIASTTAEGPLLAETSEVPETESTSVASVDPNLATSSSLDEPSVSVEAATPADGKAFTDCLAANGVVLPEGFALPSAAGQGGTPEIPAGVDLGKLQAAMGKCTDKMPAAASGTGGTEISVFVACLRENGVEVPADATLAQVPAGDPAFAAANTKCESLLQSKGEATPPIAANESPSTVG
jgi:hypothetical protein